MKEGVISVLMQDPGVTGVGANIHQAYYRLDILEGMAKTLVLTLLLRKNRSRKAGYSPGKPRRGGEWSIPGEEAKKSGNHWLDDRFGRPKQGEL